MALRSLLAGLAVAAALLAPALAQPIPGLPRPGFTIVPPDEPLAIDRLRVCADPNALPFSNDRREGFENRIAALLADRLGVPLEYTWRAQRRGFVRNTLRAGACDLVMGMPTGYELVASTRPYYRSTYVFLTRAADPPIASLDDPALRRLRVGVHLVGDDGANTPGAHALGRRGIIDNVVGFSIYGDYAEPNPPSRLVEAVADGTVDVAIVWGPYAGFFAGRQSTELRIEPVSPAFDPPNQAFVFSISMGVRRGNYPLRRRINELIRDSRAEIRAILDDYHVPLVGP